MVRLTFFRSVALQIVLVGLVSFTQPGIWNALQVDMVLGSLFP